MICVDHALFHDIIVHLVTKWKLHCHSHLVYFVTAITNIIKAVSNQTLSSGTRRCTQRCWKGLYSASFILSGQDLQYLCQYIVWHAHCRLSQSARQCTTNNSGNRNVSLISNMRSIRGSCDMTTNMWNDDNPNPTMLCLPLYYSTYHSVTHSSHVWFMCASWYKLSTVLTSFLFQTYAKDLCQTIRIMLRRNFQQRPTMK